MAKFHLLKIRTIIDIFNTENVKLLLALSVYVNLLCCQYRLGNQFNLCLLGAVTAQ